VDTVLYWQSLQAEKSSVFVDCEIGVITGLTVIFIMFPTIIIVIIIIIIVVSTHLILLLLLLSWQMSTVHLLYLLFFAYYDPNLDFFRFFLLICV